MMREIMVNNLLAWVGLAVSATQQKCRNFKPRLSENGDIGETEPFRWMMAYLPKPADTTKPEKPWLIYCFFYSSSRPGCFC